MSKKIFGLLALLSILLAFPCHAQMVQQIVGTTHPVGGLSLNPGATYIQGNYWLCTPGTSSCTSPATSATTFLVPTTANTIWVIISSNSSTNATISSVTGGGASCTPQSATNHVFNSGHDNMDVATCTGGSAGTTSITVNMSTSVGAGGYWGIAFYEILPPSGYTASFDTGGTASSSSCTTCTAVGLTTAATDTIIEAWDIFGAPAPNNFNPWNGNFFTENLGSGLILNQPSGTISAPTFSLTTSSWITFSAVAIKYSAGSYTTPTPVFSLANYTVSDPSAAGTFKSCSPTCTLTVPSTASGDLLFLVSGSDISAGGTNSHLSAVSAGGSWVFLTGASTCSLSNSQVALSCGYVLSSSSGVTSVTITMSSNSTKMAFGWYEVHRTSGSFLLDTENSTATSSLPDNFPSGQALTLGGTNEVIFQIEGSVGGISTVTLYPQAYTFNLGNLFIDGGAAGYFVGGAVLLNTANGSAPTYTYPSGTGAGFLAAGVAFK
ncbi:MAG: hypothetical protein WAU89_10965 [Candidatus Acidiferrales bacterium]